MMDRPGTEIVQMIPINRINVLNPRNRSRRIFGQIVDSISKVGLKRPITVSHRTAFNGEASYDLVCGQGRLEAFKILGENYIPAIVVDIPKEECFVLSLVENLARRHHTAPELMRSIAELSKRGYDTTQIASKTGLSREYVHDILHLINHGEERLLAAVEKEQIPITVAVEISAMDDGDVQRALTQAYDRHELRGSRLQTALRVVQQRSRQGKRFRSGSRKSGTDQKITPQAMVKAYQVETERQRALIKKADLTESRLLFIISALKEFLQDEHFVTLLRAERLDTVPRQIADLLSHGQVTL